MLKPATGLLGIAVLLLGTVLGYALLNRSEVQAADLSYEVMAQLIGGTDETRGQTEHGETDDDELECPPANPCDGCSSLDWEKRKYYNCAACNPGGDKYTAEQNWWYERLHECFTTSEGCKRRVSQQKEKRVCMQYSGTCL